MIICFWLWFVLNNNVQGKRFISELNLYACLEELKRETESYCTCKKKNKKIKAKGY